MVLNINCDYLNKFENEIEFIIKLTEFTFNTVNTTNYNKLQQIQQTTTQWTLSVQKLF